MEIDRKDFALIGALQQNALQRLEDLAKLVNLAPSSVHDRLRRLQREGVVQQWTVKVDLAKLGLGVLAYIGVKGSKTCASLVGSLEGIPYIEECHSVAGELCILLKVRVPDTAALLELIDQLREIEGIEQTETTIVLKTQFDRPASVKPPASGRKDK